MRKDERNARQISRSQTKRAGEGSARLAAAVMKLSDAQVKRLTLDDDLRAAIDRARAVKTLVARRRAERTLAGDMRGYDLVEINAQLENVDGSSDENVRQFHLAEEWRAKLIADPAALAEFPGGADDELPRLIDAARRERDTGKPPGAARSLFRHVSDRLKEPPPAADEGEAPEDVEDKDDEDDEDDDSSDAERS